MNIIEVGDEITNVSGEKSTIIEVQIGKYGIFIQEQYPGTTGQAYFPYELPPGEPTWDWYNWRHRGTTTLVDGTKIGDVSMGRFNTIGNSVEEYDKEWERTLETMRLEQMSGTHTPNNTLQSRPFTEQSRPDVL